MCLSRVALAAIANGGATSQPFPHFPQICPRVPTHFTTGFTTLFSRLSLRRCHSHGSTCSLLLPWINCSHSGIFILGLKKNNPLIFEPTSIHLRRIKLLHLHIAYSFKTANSFKTAKGEGDFFMWISADSISWCAAPDLEGNCSD